MDKNLFDAFIKKFIQIKDKQILKNIHTHI
jgi:hypothetical protein